MRFKGLDLNLLGALDVLLDTRSVSAAARQMNLSQPAMSAALTRLRDFFGDELLVAQGKRMYPTAYAEALVPQVRECLHAVESMLVTSGRFDPATSQRRFRLILSDYVMTAVLAPALQTLAATAPGIRLEITLPSPDTGIELREGRADLFVAPEQFIFADHPSELLCEERYVVVGWAENPLFEDVLTLEDFSNAGHVVVRFGGPRDLSFADRQVRLLGIERRIEVEAPSFTTLPWLLVGSQRLALMQERLAQRVVPALPLRTAPIPFPFQPMREMIQYHSSRKNDEGLRWMIERLREPAVLM
ncbi:LysR family transcriptional regulator [Sphingomonas sp. R1]|uniref:LysR family transcriptional regulator n=1 Tax=Sphingomonas sp. R1 TaxID=399176 RepID=UPI0022248B0E|nr:LysR family transcriptional regulator [Sphingomonas sp. R1]UYY78542.1 LysR family transcriptional regulator [Sphingomonas sp. R1]